MFPLASSAVALVAALLAGAPPAPPLCKGRLTAGYDPSQDRLPSRRASLEVQAAYTVLCPAGDCGRGLLRQNPTVGMNALTFVSGIDQGQNTQVKIVYAPEFLNTLSKKFGAGASFGVLAHEVGHHLTATKGWRNQLDSSWDEELRADYLAGCALARAGRPTDDLENALRALASVATETHPSSQHRNPVVRKGYEDCKRVQDAEDARRSDEGFGLGTLIRKSSRQEGCYSYFYRSAEEVNRRGPIAARRARSRSFADRASCEDTRRRLTDARLVISEPCTCPGES